MKLINTLGNNLELIIIILGFIGLLKITESSISSMVWVVGILLGSVLLSLTNLVIKNRRYIRELKSETKKRFKEEIKRSIDDEIKESKYNKKIEICYDRIRLYTQAGSGAFDIPSSLKKMSLALFVCVFLLLLPNFEIWSNIHTFHVIYFLIIYSMYHFMRIVFIFSEIIKEEIKED